MTRKQVLLSDTPLDTIEQVRAWHNEQVERHMRLAKTRNVATGFSFEKTLQSADLRRADFHQRAVLALDKAIAALEAAADEIETGNSQARANTALSEMSQT
jgi:hypothetical protein